MTGCLTEVPESPPVLVGCPKSFPRRTIAPSFRDVEERGVASSSRSALLDELTQFERQDKLPFSFTDSSMEFSSKTFKTFYS